MEREILLRRATTEGAVFKEVRHPQGFWMPVHTHDDPHFALVLEGCIESASGSRASVATSACVQFIPAGETHASRYQDGVRVFVASFHPDWWSRFGNGRAALEREAVFRGDLAAGIVHRLYEEFSRPDDLTPTMLEGLSYELVATMARGVKRSPAEAAPRWLRRVEEALRAHPETAYSVASLAGMVGVHPGHLMRAFRHHHRCTIGDFVRRLRIERACRLLADPQEGQTLGEIAYEVGFSDQSAFGKTFKRATGMTPGEFRARRGGASPEPRMFD